MSDDLTIPSTSSPAFIIGFAAGWDRAYGVKVSTRRYNNEQDHDDYTAGIEAGTQDAMLEIHRDAIRAATRAEGAK